MNRCTFHVAALVAAVAAGALSGCSEESPKINPPFKKVDPTAAPAKANYFEAKKDGTTYVFSRVESMSAFREGRAPANATTQQLGGKTVVFENRNYTDYNRLVAEYKKAHNVQ